MTDPETARRLWVKERATHEAFGQVIRRRLAAALRTLGTWYEVTARAKEIDSLVKKLLKKPEHSYETLPDKVGARVVLRYRSDIPRVVEVARAMFDCDPPDDKVKGLGVDRVGYQSLHLDRVRLRNDDPDAVQYPPTSFWLELQVRTIAQHLWSEMSHDTVYKNEETLAALPADMKRRVHLMAGQIEVADREFDRLNAETPISDEGQLLQVLERHYFRFTSKRPDLELSLQVLGKTKQLYSAATQDVLLQLDEFLTKKHDVLQHVYEQAGQVGLERKTAFLFQPEVLMIYERLLNNPAATRRVWNESYPEPELERIANEFGVSFD